MSDSPRWYEVQGYVLRLNVSANAKYLLLVIHRHMNRKSGRAWVSQNHLAEEMSLSRSTIQRAFREVKKSGIVVSEIKRTGKGFDEQFAEYWIDWNRLIELAVPAVERVPANPSSPPTFTDAERDAAADEIIREGELKRIQRQVAVNKAVERRKNTPSWSSLPNEARARTESTLQRAIGAWATEAKERNAGCEPSDWDMPIFPPVLAAHKVDWWHAIDTFGEDFVLSLWTNVFLKREKSFNGLESPIRYFLAHFGEFKLQSYEPEPSVDPTKLEAFATAMSRG